MSAIKDVIQAMDAVLAQLGQARTSTIEAAALATRGLGLAQEVGTPSGSEDILQVKEVTEAAAEEIAAIIARIERARQIAQAMVTPT